MSTILVDNLTGKTSAGSITVTSEGGAATQSLQQGLAKAWVSVDQDTTGHPIYDSINISSSTDAGTGRTRLPFTNSFNNDDYADVIAGAAQNESAFAGGTFSVTQYVGSEQKTSSQITTDCRNNAGTDNDNHDTKLIIMGDLA